MRHSDPRHLALDILLRVEKGAFSDLALDSALEEIPDRRNRALATELVYGVLRLRGRLDFALGRFCRKPLEKTEPAVLALLRLGAYQILQLDRVPDRAAVHEAVEGAREMGLERATGFINGILRSLVREKEKLPWPDPETHPREHLEHFLSLPRWLADRWLKEFGREEASSLAASMLLPGPFTLRVNTLRTSRDALLRRLEAAGHGAVPTPFAPEGITVNHRGESPLPGLREGECQVQDEASMLVAHLLTPGPGEFLLDACAAPGGKTTHLAALAGNEARILALDLHSRRVALVEEGARRLGAKAIETRAWDLTHPPSFLQEKSFDGGLVDAPCSGLGVLRRNPEIRWRRTPEDLPRLARLQRTILEHVSPLVKRGGRLVYSVCTLTPEETTGVVDPFLADHPEFILEDLRESFPEEWRVLFDSRGALRTFPHRHGMDAFFAARLRRKP